MLDRVLEGMEARIGQCSRFIEHFLHLLNRETATNSLVLLLDFARRLMQYPSFPNSQFYYSNDVRLLTDLVLRHLKDTQYAKVAISSLRLLEAILNETNWRTSPDPYQVLELRRVLDSCSYGWRAPNGFARSDSGDAESQQEQVRVWAKWVLDKTRAVLDLACARAEVDLAMHLRPASNGRSGTPRLASNASSRSATPSKAHQTYSPASSQSSLLKPPSHRSNRASST